MGDSIVLTRDSSENPMKQTKILGYCQFAINCRGNTDITIAKEGEVVNLWLINTGFEKQATFYHSPSWIRFIVEIGDRKRRIQFALIRNANVP